LQQNLEIQGDSGLSRIVSRICCRMPGNTVRKTERARIESGSRLET
jgi:hypothetical protein